MRHLIQRILAYFKKPTAIAAPIVSVQPIVAAQVETQLQAEVKSLIYPARRMVSDIPAVFSNVKQPTLADARNWKEEAIAKASQLRNR